MFTLIYDRPLACNPFLSTITLAHMFSEISPTELVMSSYCSESSSSSSSPDINEHYQVARVAQVNPSITPSETAFKEAVSRVCFLGAEAAKIRGILYTLPPTPSFERTYYTRQWYYLMHYHRLWSKELMKTSMDYLHEIMTI